MRRTILIGSCDSDRARRGSDRARRVRRGAVCLGPTRIVAPAPSSSSRYRLALCGIRRPPDLRRSGAAPPGCGTQHSSRPGKQVGDRRAGKHLGPVGSQAGRLLDTVGGWALGIGPRPGPWHTPAHSAGVHPQAARAHPHRGPRATASQGASESRSFPAQRPTAGPGAWRRH